ncbi:hypothetical protein CXB51_035450 [Gossypium anomalum]|uniref:AB hydrolase-1 domain-containing protein n=1 Tax=Gossypium anomalum TaxID=47600 RepID=A0A8J6CFP6_9ROSI|nr:hypothetical protein CXB51_035450 [Gossypium anomalum]
MEKIQHNHVQAKELKLHVTQIGTSPKVVVFLHGFPEIWYSWRHQMIAGLWTLIASIRTREGNLDFVDDVVALLDSRAHLVAKDFGAFVAAMVGKLHPHRVSTIVLLGVPFLLPGLSPLQAQLPLIPPSFYMLRWMVPGRAEADFGRFDTKIVIRKFTPGCCYDQEILDLVDSSAPLPPWLSEEDLAGYGSLYEKSGFRTALQVPYRTMMQSCRLDDGKIRVPGLVIMGEQDHIMKFTGLEDYFRTGKVKEFAPNLDVTFLAQGNHFVQEQLPEEVNHLIISFLNKHCK